MKLGVYKFLFLAGAIGAGILLIKTQFVFAAEPGGVCALYRYPWCDAGTSLPGLVNELYTYALGIVGGAAFGVIVYGAVRHMTAAGNPAGITDAKEWIKGALFGVVLLFGAYLIFNTINPNIITLRGVNLSPITATGTAPGTGGDGRMTRCPPNMPNRYVLDRGNLAGHAQPRCTGCDRNDADRNCGEIFCTRDNYGPVCNDWHKVGGVPTSAQFRQEWID